MRVVAYAIPSKPPPPPPTPSHSPRGETPRRRQSPQSPSLRPLGVLLPSLRGDRCAGALCAPSSFFIACGLSIPSMHSDPPPCARSTNMTQCVCSLRPLYPCYAAALPCFRIATRGYLVAAARARAPMVVCLVMSVPLYRAFYMLGCGTSSRVSRPSVSCPIGQVVYRSRICASRQGVAPLATPLTHAAKAALPTVGR